ncbi:GspH/FimT family protein [Facilibium subflavum]|uniref:GspH/FimT family protein n=1 Tax=Facilibium subflavum TaxID=2219058 RepID=UPI000E652A07|nr:GspH/FimT family protein [Facilibium subflavum]
MFNCKPNETKKQKNSAFSMVEVLIVVTVIAVIVAVALPLSIGILGGNRAQSYLHQIKSALEIARITAISKNISTIMCPTSNGTACAAVSNDNWANNQVMVFTSSAGDPSDVDNIITIIQAPENGEYVKWQGALNLDYIEIRANGFSATNGTMTYCAKLDSSGQFKTNQELVINQTGRVIMNYLSTPQSC